MSWNKEHVVLQPLIHWGPAWICYLGLLRLSLRQKLQNGLSINFLLQNHISNITNIIKKSVINAISYHFGRNKYKTNVLVPPVVIDWRLCNIKVMTNWFPSEDILELHQSFSSCYLLTCGGWREGGRGRIREKNREKLIPSWGTTIKSHVNLGTSQTPYFLIPSHWE